MNTQEASLFAASPVQAYKVFACARTAQDLERKNWKSEVGSNDNGDAFRHCAWSFCSLFALVEYDGTSWGKTSKTWLDAH
jgi:hypothetical protein